MFRFSWRRFNKQAHITYTSLDLPISNFSTSTYYFYIAETIDNQLDFHKAVSRYIEIKVKENV